MYVIRTDAPRRVLTIECSGHLPTAEALRALSQAALLMEAGGITRVLCDLSRVTRGPGGLLPVAAALHVRRDERWRVAFVTGPRQRRMVQRLVRFSGLRKGVVVLGRATDARSWLEAPDGVVARRLTETDLRHAEHILRGGRPATADERPAAATTPGATSAA